MRIAAWELSGTEDNPGGTRLTTTWMRNGGKANNKVREMGPALSENLQNVVENLGCVYAKASGRTVREER